MLIWHRAQVRRLVKVYVAYYNQARPHQGIEQRIPEHYTLPKGPNPKCSLPRVTAKSALGGVHHHCGCNPRLNQTRRFLLVPHKENHPHEADGSVWIQPLPKSQVSCTCNATRIANELSPPQRSLREIVVEPTVIPPASAQRPPDRK
jgi:hypothetical protein